MATWNVGSIKEVSLSLPFSIGSVKWVPDRTEQEAAWALYIELVTRISVQRLDLDQGLVREAMNSLYSLFATTREILKKAGPGVGISKNSVGGIAIMVLNNGLRPFLSKWHPLLHAWESQKPSSLSAKEHERNWSEEAKLRGELEKLRKDLESYSCLLAEIVGVEP